MANVQDSKLIQNMDKVAYVVAGVVGLVILFIGLTSGRSLGGLDDEKYTVRRDIDERRREPIDVPAVPELVSAIRQQWTVPAPTVPFPEWASERVPSLAQWIAGAAGETARHEDPELLTIECKRNPVDAERNPYSLYLEVRGRLGQLRYAQYREVRLFRKVDDGEFEEVAGADIRSVAREAMRTGELVYTDNGVEAGRTYAYRVHTIVEKDPAAGDRVTLPPDAVERTSNECGMLSPLPYDYDVRVSFLTPHNASDGTPPSFVGTVVVSPAEAGAEAMRDPATTFDEHKTFGPEVRRRGDRTDPLFEIQTIDETGVTVRNNATRHDETFNAQSPERTVAMPAAVQCEPKPAPPPADEDDLGAVDDGGAVEEPGAVDSDAGEGALPGMEADPSGDTDTTGTEGESVEGEDSGGSSRKGGGFR